MIEYCPICEQTFDMEDKFERECWLYGHDCDPFWDPISEDA